PLIKEFKDTKVIIDHLGRPFQGRPEEHETVVQWSRFPNTVIKLSAIPDQNKYPHRDIAPVIKRLASEYGADRMIYGGGFNAEATQLSYRRAFDRAVRLPGSACRTQFGRGGGIGCCHRTRA
ncbi:MAG: hypothetical protein EBS78_05335, partial [Altererythrobacter sp.]|nr:hypothetical protein [Altererythrobacter sp.]